MAQVKDLEYLGDATWGYTSYYWNSTDSKYYYTKGMRDANKNSTREAFVVTDDTQLGKLKKAQNRHFCVWVAGPLDHFADHGETAVFTKLNSCWYFLVDQVNQSLV